MQALMLIRGWPSSIRSRVPLWIPMRPCRAGAGSSSRARTSA